MTDRGITRAQALEYQRRWRLVRERTLDEERATSLEQRFDELERLMQSVDDFGWRAQLDDDEPIRARWALLRERLAQR